MVPLPSIGAKAESSKATFYRVGFRATNDLLPCWQPLPTVSEVTPIAPTIAPHRTGRNSTKRGRT